MEGERKDGIEAIEEEKTDGDRDRRGRYEIRIGYQKKTKTTMTHWEAVLLTLPAIPITKFVIARRNIPGTINVLRPTIYHQPHHPTVKIICRGCRKRWPAFDMACGVGLRKIPQ